jgi:membrane protein YdbS with pleckstrin-like domain
MVIPEPTQRLAPASRALWRTEGAGRSVFAAILAAIATGSLSGWDDRPGWVVPLLWILVALAAIVQIGIEPELRYRRWRYAIHDDEIDIRHGVWSIKRTLVPITRVQHVDTEQGVLQQMFGVATVVFHTAAGKTVIPALEPEEAERARNRIALLARGERDV